jgi:MFS family permease
MLGTTVGLAPAVALGALAALVRPDLGFSEAQLGVAIAVFFGSSAVASVPAGRLAEAWGPLRAARRAAYLGMAALLGIGLLATSWASLLPFMVVAGAGNALAQVATNGLVADVVPAERNGLGFGIKQSAGPLASLAAGVSVPAIGLTLGWRWTFVTAAALALPAVLAIGRDRSPTVRRTGRGSAHLAGRRTRLAMLAAVAALGAGAVNCLNGFYVVSAVSQHVDVAAAGVYFAVGGLSGIVVRVVGGWWSDHARFDRLSLATVMLGVGAAAFLALAHLGTGFLLPATVLAFGAGWGWNGLVLAAVVDAYPEAPSAATGVTQAGLYGGAVALPVIFGFVAQYGGYPAAWTAAAVSLASAALLLFVVKRRPAARP